MFKAKDQPMKFIKYVILSILPLIIAVFVEIPSEEEIQTLDISELYMNLGLISHVIAGLMITTFVLLLVRRYNLIVKVSTLFFLPLVALGLIGVNAESSEPPSVMILFATSAASMLACIPILLLRSIIKWGMNYSLSEHRKELKNKQKLKAEAKKLKVEAKIEKIEYQRQADAHNVHYKKYGVLAVKIICPHCNEKGGVWRNENVPVNELTRETGIGAVIGKRTVTEKKVTNLHCKNCKTTWAI